MTGSGRTVPWGWYGFYSVLLVAGIAGSVAAGYQGDLFWLAIGWAIALGVITRLLGLRPPRIQRAAMPPTPLAASESTTFGLAPGHHEVEPVSFEETRGDASLDVVGEQYYPAAVAAFRTLTRGGLGKTLVMPEPDNPYDSNAIVVYAWIEADSEVLPVGHLAAEQAVLYRPVFDYLGTKVIACEAAIAPHRGGGGMDGVVLHLGTPGELIAELWTRDHPIEPSHPWADKVVSFTGFGLSLAGVTLDREGQSLLARRGGCLVAPHVTKKVVVCVATDARNETASIAKAHEYGIRVVGEREFWMQVGIPESAIGQGVPRWAYPGARW